MSVSVLVVDDEKDLVEGVTVLLEDLGYQVYGAHDGQTALAVLQEKKPDVLILDMNLPRWSGEAVLRELSAFGLKTKVIISSGHDLNDGALRARFLKNFGVSAFLGKPASIQEMIDAIQKVLKNE